MLKRCPECKQEKSVSEFYTKARYRKYPNSLAGHSHQCKSCDKAARKRYVDSNPDKKASLDRGQHLKRYGLTIETYNALYNKQEGCCAGCGLHQSEFNRNLCVDHDHTMGLKAVRGLLCVTCNLILGYATDNVAVLQRLAKYLDSYSPELAETKTNVVEVKFPKKVG